MTELTDPQKQYPKQIQKLGPARLMVVWQDGKVSLYDAPFLQLACRCAKCVDELTGEVRINESMVNPRAEIREIIAVGRYGIRFRWSQGCEAGIYTFDYLKKLDCQKQFTKN